MSSSTQMSQSSATQSPAAAAIDLKLEVVAIPVSDVDRAKRFYEGLGWRVDADFTNGKNWRGVQVTPPGSQCSVHFGQGITTAPPGSAQGLFLVVDDMNAARTDLLARGVDVTETFHFDEFGGPPVPGPSLDRSSYGSYASFKDPDGNAWLLQEVTTRLPGRGLSWDVRSLTSLLREAEENHGAYEAVAPKHHWSDWYSAFIVARERGRTIAEAASEAGLHMDRIRK